MAAVQEEHPHSMGSEAGHQASEEASRRRMISHIVLFRPKPSLTAEQRAHLLNALRNAVEGIGQIKRFSIGKRILLNRPGYEKLMAEHYEYSAVLEFDSEADLIAYLDHPAHDTLGRLLFTAADAVLAYDFTETELSNLRG